MVVEHMVVEIPSKTRAGDWKATGTDKKKHQVVVPRVGHGMIVYDGSFRLILDASPDTQPIVN